MEASEYHLDEIDLALIQALKNDARTPFRDIARKFKVSPDTISNRYRKLQKKGVIQGSTVLINPEKIGYKSVIILMIDVEPEYSSWILNELIKMVDIIVATETIGDCDLMAIGVARNFEHLSDLTLRISNIPHIKNVQVSFLIKYMKIYPEYFII